MDQLDQRLIAELRINGRASVPKLAQILGVARGTVQTRLDRLIDGGVIRGFTVRLRDGGDDSLIRGVMLIELAGRNIAATVATIRKTPGIAQLYNTNGTWDMIGEVEVASMAELSRLASSVRGLDGVAKSETFLILGAA